MLPDGKVLTYGYDAKGEVRTFADQLLQTSRYEYNKAAFPHYLTDLIDPRGIKVARNWDPTTTAASWRPSTPTAIASSTRTTSRRRGTGRSAGSPADLRL